MKTLKRKITVIALTVALILSTALGLFFYFRTSNKATAIDGSWTANKSGNGVGAENWTNNGTNFVFTPNGKPNNIWDSVYYRANSMSGGSFTIETMAKTNTDAMGTSNEVIWGIVPHFENYTDMMVIYLAWRTEGATRMFQQVGVYDTYSGNTNPNGVWGASYWSNGSPLNTIVSNRSYASNQDIKVRLEVSGKDVAIYFQDTYIATYTTLRGTTPSYDNVGVMASPDSADTITFASFNLYEPLTALGKTFDVSNTYWSVSGTSLKSTASGSAAYANKALVTVGTGSGQINSNKKTYLYKTTFTATGADTIVGLLPYYKDSLNYIAIYIQYGTSTGGTCESITVYQEKNGVAYGGHNNTGYKDYWTSNTDYSQFGSLKPDVSTNLEVYRSQYDNGDHYRIFINGTLVTNFVTDGSYNTNTAKLGLSVMDGTATFTAIEVKSVTATTATVSNETLSYQPIVWKQSGSNLVQTGEEYDGLDSAVTLKNSAYGATEDYTEVIVLRGTNSTSSVIDTTYNAPKKHVYIKVWSNDSDYITAQLVFVSNKLKALNLADYKSSTKTFTDRWVEAPSTLTSVSINSDVEIRVERLAGDGKENNATADLYKIYVNGVLALSKSSALSYNQKMTTSNLTCYYDTYTVKYFRSYSFASGLTKLKSTLQNLGASIRFSDPTGIRFLLSVDRVLFRNMQQQYASNSFEVGILRVPKNTVASVGNSDAITISSQGAKTDDIRVWYTTDVYDGRITYTFKDMPSTTEAYNATFTYCGYVSYVEGGTTKYLYSATLTRSAKYVAEQALADTSKTYTTDQKAILNTIAGKS